MQKINMLFIIIPIIVIILLTFLIVIIQSISPKFRGKMMSKQVKAMKYMVDESKDDLKSISTDVANATKEGIKTTTSAIKEGLTERQNSFCKYCGSNIDSDSKFCKKCGKEQ